jgi:hypothetical protein
MHGYKTGYADGFLGGFKSGTKYTYGWPGANIEDNELDINNISLYAKSPYIEITGSAMDGNSASATGNVITLDEAVSGSDKSDSLGAYDVQPGDYVAISDPDRKVTKIAKVTGIDYLARSSAYVDETPEAVGNTVSLIKASGTFSGSTRCTYLVKVNSVSDKSVTASVSVLAGSDNNTAGVVTLSSTATAIGNLGVKIALSGTGHAVGDAWRVTGYPGSKQSARKIQIDSTVTLSGDVKLEFYSNRFISGFVDIPTSTNTIECDADGISIPAELSIVLSDGRSRNIYMCDLYVEYRELCKEGTLALLSSVNQNSMAWAGVCDPRNPMGLMAAAANSADNGSFFMVATDGDTDADYVKAIEYVAQFEAGYALVPYSNSSTVVNALIKVIDKYSAPEVAQFKRGWVGSATTSDLPVYVRTKTDAILTATAVGDGFITLTEGDTTPDATFAAGVVDGDYIRVYSGTGDYAEHKDYKIKSAKSSAVFQVNGKPSFSDARVEFIRKLNSMEYAKQVSDEARRINNVRINMVWGDRISAFGYDDLPRSVACAALAAQRAGLPPHAPMTDMAVPGITTQDSSKFSDTEYEMMNDGGVWVIHGNLEGSTVTYHQITTKTDGSIAEEDSCVSNGDAVIRYFRTAIKSRFTGSSNVYDGIIPAIESQLIAEAEAIKAIPYPEVYGPLLLDFKVNSIEIPASNRATVVGDFSVTLGRPYAGGDFTFNLV